MDSPCIKQTVCKVLKIFQYGKYLVAYVLKHFYNLEVQYISLMYIKCACVYVGLKVLHAACIIIYTRKSSVYFILAFFFGGCLQRASWKISFFTKCVTL